MNLERPFGDGMCHQILMLFRLSSPFKASLLAAFLSFVCLVLLRRGMATTRRIGAALLAHWVILAYFVSLLRYDLLFVWLGAGNSFLLWKKVSEDGDLELGTSGSIDVFNKIFLGTLLVLGMLVEVLVVALSRFSIAALVYTYVLPIFLYLASRSVLRSRTTPGPCGWIVLLTTCVMLTLCFPFLHWKLASAILLAGALTPTWLVLAVAAVVGLSRWPKIRARVAQFVCRTKFHRFVPGPQLGWVTRWSGRWLWREQTPPANMADSYVCRCCGGTSRYEGIRAVVAVLDQQEPRTVWQDGDVLRINWLAHKEPIEFDAVEVLRASDDDVDAFVKYARFETIEQVQRRLRKMRCVIGGECRFVRADTTKMNLEHTFGTVTAQ